MNTELPPGGVEPDAETAARLEGICAEFCWLVDHGMADRTEHLFTEDVCYIAQGRESRGLADVMRRMAERAARRDYVTRHIASGFRFQRIGPDEVQGQCVMVVYRNRSAAALVADVHDVFRRQRHGAWRLARRHIISILDEAGAVKKDEQ